MGRGPYTDIASAFELDAAGASAIVHHQHHSGWVRGAVDLDERGACRARRREDTREVTRRVRDVRRVAARGLRGVVRARRRQEVGAPENLGGAQQQVRL